ncbi:MAG: hypothetical protein LBR13_06010 [Dysgonamonadaceae bacterium]|jgi:hypothetical protein|nr:hypothetical protein [Dysgonamonadaceae bacterium]
MKLIPVILFVVFTTNLHAQTYASRKLETLGEMLPATCLPECDSIFVCKKIIANKSLTVNYNAKNEISHLGVSLFSNESKDLINKPVCNFVERIFLELLLQTTQSDVKRKLNRNKISIRKDGAEYGSQFFNSLEKVLSDIQHPTQFVIRRDSVYTAVWEYGDNEDLTVSFPVSRELIFGTDKKESDDSIGDWLDCECQFQTAENQEFTLFDLPRLEGTDLYVRKGGFYLTEKICGDTYYQRSDSLYRIVFDENFPEVSLSNLFISKQVKNTLNLKITHRRYGGFTPEFTVPLNRLLCLFNREFETYCVIHPPEQNKIRVSVILHNRDFDYVHLLRIKTEKERLFADGGVLTADLYTNIPMHNLINLF